MDISSVLGCAGFAMFIWAFLAMLRREERERLERTRHREAQVQRFLEMLERTRAYLSVWSVRPPA